MLLSVIISVFNEKSTVAEVINKVSAIDLPIEKEIIVVDDGSNDGTAEILQLSHNKMTHLYSSPVNVGKGAAVRIGLSMVKGDIILIQDADLELDPNEYLQLIQPIIDGKTSVVYGSRFLTPNKLVPFIRRLANFILTFLTNVLYGSRLTDMGTAYKVFTKDVAEKLNLRANRFDIDPEITAQICKLKIKITEVPISYCPRTVLEGKKINWKDGIKAIITLFRYRINL
jgi:dolichol-phosphate mannosyltransferase